MPELALVGRSNVGKSTLINALCGHRLARTSAAPGKTRLVNVYRVRPRGRRPFVLVDLPGYGYARGGAPAASGFERLTRQYFEAPRRRRPAVLHVVDARHPGLESDLQAAAWLEATGAAVARVATKIDKLSRAERVRAMAAFNDSFTGPVLAVSAVTGEGLKDLWTQIAHLLNRPPRTLLHP